MMLLFSTYTVAQKIPGEINFPPIAASREGKNLTPRALLCLVFCHVVWITSQIVQHGKICLARVIDLALSVVANCLFGLVDGEGKYEVGLSPYAIDN
jgi:hypothetical protein